MTVLAQPQLSTHQLRSIFSKTSYFAVTLKQRHIQYILEPKGMINTLKIELRGNIY